MIPFLVFPIIFFMLLALVVILLFFADPYSARDKFLPPAVISFLVSALLAFIALIAESNLPYTKKVAQFPIQFDGQLYYFIDTDINEKLNPANYTKEKINTEFYVTKYQKNKTNLLVNYSNFSDQFEYRIEKVKHE